MFDTFWKKSLLAFCLILVWLWIFFWKWYRDNKESWDEKINYIWEEITDYILYNKKFSDVDYEKYFSILSKIINKSQSKCDKKGFIEYRKCMVTQLENKKSEIPIQFISEFEVLRESISDEISFYNYYKELDTLTNSSIGFQRNEEIECRVVMSWVLILSWYWYSDNKFFYSIWYRWSFSWIEEIITWRNSKIVSYDQSDMIWNNPYLPCVYATFGQEHGMIYTALKKWENIYLLVHSSDWAWSWEHWYMIIVFNNSEKKFYLVWEWYNWVDYDVWNMPSVIYDEFITFCFTKDYVQEPFLYKTYLDALSMEIFKKYEESIK